MFIARSKLVVPFETTGLCLKSNNTIRKQVVASPYVCLKRGARIARAPEHKILLRIVGANVPSWSAASFPGVPGPCLMTEFTRPWNSVKLPEHPALRRVKRGQKSSNPKLSPSDTHDDAVSHSQRRPRHRIALTIVGNLSN